MHWDEWMTLVGKLNLAFPHQRIEPGTGREWYGLLRTQPLAAVERAYLRCLDEREFLSCHALLDAISSARRERSYGQSTGAPLPTVGVPMPPETRAAIDLLRRSKLLPGEPGRLEPAVARAQIDALADQLSERTGT